MSKRGRRFHEIFEDDSDTDSPVVHVPPPISSDLLDIDDHSSSDFEDTINNVWLPHKRTTRKPSKSPQPRSSNKKSATNRKWPTHTGYTFKSKSTSDDKDNASGSQSSTRISIVGKIQQQTAGRRQPVQNKVIYISSDSDFEDVPSSTKKKACRQAQPRLNFTQLCLHQRPHSLSRDASSHGDQEHEVAAAVGGVSQSGEKGKTVGGLSTSFGKAIEVVVSSPEQKDQSQNEIIPETDDETQDPGLEAPCDAGVAATGDKLGGKRSSGGSGLLPSGPRGNEHGALMKKTEDKPDKYTSLKKKGSICCADDQVQTHRETRGLGKLCPASYSSSDSDSSDIIISTPVKTPSTKVFISSRRPQNASSRFKPHMTKERESSHSDAHTGPVMVIPETQYVTNDSCEDSSDSDVFRFVSPITRKLYEESTEEGDIAITPSAIPEGQENTRQGEADTRNVKNQRVQTVYSSTTEEESDPVSIGPKPKTFSTEKSANGTSTEEDSEGSYVQLLPTGDSSDDGDDNAGGLTVTHLRPNRVSVTENLSQSRPAKKGSLSRSVPVQKNLTSDDEDDLPITELLSRHPSPHNATAGRKRASSPSCSSTPKRVKAQEEHAMCQGVDAFPLSEDSLEVIQIQDSPPGKRQPVPQAKENEDDLSEEWDDYKPLLSFIKTEPGKDEDKQAAASTAVANKSTSFSFSQHVSVYPTDQTELADPDEDDRFAELTQAFVDLTEEEEVDEDEDDNKVSNHDSDDVTLLDFLDPWDTEQMSQVLLDKDIKKEPAAITNADRKVQNDIVKLFDESQLQADDGYFQKEDHVWSDVEDEELLRLTDLSERSAATTPTACPSPTELIHIEAVSGEFEGEEAVKKVPKDITNGMREVAVKEQKGSFVHNVEAVAKNEKDGRLSSELHSTEAQSNLCDGRTVHRVTTTKLASPFCGIGTERGVIEKEDLVPSKTSPLQENTDIPDEVLTLLLDKSMELDSEITEMVEADSKETQGLGAEIEKAVGKSNEGDNQIANWEDALLIEVAEPMLDVPFSSAPKGTQLRKQEEKLQEATEKEAGTSNLKISPEGISSPGVSVGKLQLEPQVSTGFSSDARVQPDSLSTTTTSKHTEQTSETLHPTVEARHEKSSVYIDGTSSNKKLDGTTKEKVADEKQVPDDKKEKETVRRSRTKDQRSKAVPSRDSVQSSVKEKPPSASASEKAGSSSSASKDKSTSKKDNQKHPTVRSDRKRSHSKESSKSEKQAKEQKSRESEKRPSRDASPSRKSDSHASKGKGTSRKATSAKNKDSSHTLEGKKEATSKREDMRNTTKSSVKSSSKVSREESGACSVEDSPTCGQQWPPPVKRIGRSGAPQRKEKPSSSKQQANTDTTAVKHKKPAPDPQKKEDRKKVKEADDKDKSKHSSTETKEVHVEKQEHISAGKGTKVKDKKPAPDPQKREDRKKVKEADDKDKSRHSSKEPKEVHVEKQEHNSTVKGTEVLPQKDGETEKNHPKPREMLPVSKSALSKTSVPDEQISVVSQKAISEKNGCTEGAKQATSAAKQNPPTSSTLSRVDNTNVSLSAVSSGRASPAGQTPSLDAGPAPKKRRVKLPVAAPCSSTIPGCFQSRSGDPYDLLKAMPAAATTEDSKSITKEDFLHVVLQWLPMWLEEMDAQGGDGYAPLPPIMEKAVPAMLPSDRLWPVPDVFESTREYIEILLGHILHETWSSIYSDWRRAKGAKKTFLIPQSRDPNSRRLITLVFQGLHDRSAYLPLSVGDLVIIHMKVAGQSGANGKPCPVFGYVQTVVKTDLRNRENLNPKLGNFHQVRNSNKVVINVWISYFYPLSPANELIAIEPVTSLVSVQRQVEGLGAISRNPLCQDLLQPTSLNTFIPPDLRNVQLDAAYNPSQQRAIQSVTDALLQPYAIKRVRLLQGPPGTGKSYTIQGIIRNTAFQTTKDGSKSCLMLCAPSNAAVDELVRRISLENDFRQKQKGDLIRLVRIGSTNSMRSESLQYAIDTLVKEAWTKKKLLEQIQSMPLSIRKDMMNVYEQLPKLREQLDAARKANMVDQVRKLEQDIIILEKKQSKFGGDPRKGKEPTAREQAQLRYEVLAHAHVVCCTLSSAGSRVISEALEFGQMQAKNPKYKGARLRFTGILIDEACQSVEVEALIPLQYGITKLVLIGDPQQLPPTVISKDAETMKFNQSLFERLYNYFRIKGSSPVHVLDTQYRMHPEISAFPGQHIYEGWLKTHPSLIKKRSLFPFRHYLVFDLLYSKEELDHRSLSVRNHSEAEFIISIVQHLAKGSKVKPQVMGIITPYKQQKILLNSHLARCNMGDVEVGTVDGFQGQEKDVIIVSCVRAQSANQKIGFVADKRRLNVALTRAKYACYVVGHLDSLTVDEDWNALIQDAGKRKVRVMVEKDSDRDNVIRRACKKRQEAFPKDCQKT